MRYLHAKFFHQYGLIQMNKIFTALFSLAALYTSVVYTSGCAQIGAPSGGPRDSIGPVLVKATPELRTTNFSGNKIILTFDEYIEVKESQKNVLVSPLQTNNPNVNYNLKTVTIRLKDTLKPNTTYSIQFGNAIVDVNESNILKDFTYVFSTGNTIDSMSLSGKVILAESGKVDSTINVLLYKNLNDSAVQKLKPDYIARLNGDGVFKFDYLPKGSFRIYALNDKDGNKYYSQPTEIFAFTNDAVSTGTDTSNIILYAYAEEKAEERSRIQVLAPKPEKKLKYTSNLLGTQDLLTELEVKFNNPLAFADTNKLILTDTNNIAVAGGRPVIDSTQKIISYNPVWQPGAAYRLIIPADAVRDSIGNTLAKADTITFVAKANADYARVVLRFKNYNPAKNPVIQLYIGDLLKFSFPITSAEWRNNRLPPGEYEMRILNDDNNDGVWTPGDYEKKRQPEKAITLPQKLSLRADWDNERDLELGLL
jgi:uncharacterized protein (DUF2141 family)